MPTSNKARPGGTSLSRPRPLTPPDSSTDAILRFQTHLLDAVGQAVIATDLVSDVVMPGLGGRDLVTHVRDTYPELRVLFGSGYTEEGIRRHGVLDTESAFLEKPFTAERLAQKVSEILDTPRDVIRGQR